MSTAIDTAQLLKLSPKKRLELISLIWNSLIEEGKATPPDDRALDEAERRVEELKKHPERAISADDMRKRRGWKA